MPKPTQMLSACLLLAASAAHAQTQCWAPRDEQDSSTKPPAAAMRRLALAAEDAIRNDQAYLDSPIPVRMRTMIAIGPYEFASGRMFVNAYPERAGVNVVWRGTCDVIPQADRIDAAIGQIGVFFNPTAGVMMPPGATFVPRFEGMVNGYPRYNGWIYMTRDGRMPWIPETLGARLDRLIAARERTLADWLKDPVRTKAPQDPASVQKTYQLLKKSDPAGAERYLAQMTTLAAEIDHKVRDVYPATTQRMQDAVADAKRYKAAFSLTELAQPAVWADADGNARKQLDARIQQLHASRKPGVSKEAHLDIIGEQISRLSDEYDLTHIRPGDAEHAQGFVPDPAYYDKNPNHVRLITVLFSTGKRDSGPAWMQRAAARFDFAPLAKLLNQ